MSLYGALFAGVGGLKAQGTKIGIISDNIANVNTTGYKATKAAFETLVVNSTSNVSYAPGGVIANNVQLIDKQGILTATDSPLDIAMSGSGFFAVNGRADGTAQPLYTRAGSFRQDQLGNFVNAQGFFLQGWPLDREGRLPGEPGNLNATSSANLDSLNTVNIETQSGVASATTRVEIGANLDAGEGIHPGSGIDIAMDVNNPANFGISAADIIVPGGVNGITPQTPDGVTPGDALTVTTGNGLSYTFEYGGLVRGNDVALGIFDAITPTGSFFGTTGLGAFSTAARSFTIQTSTAGLKTFTYVTSSPNPVNGEFSNLNNLASAINQAAGLTARVQGGRLYVAPENANDSMSFVNIDDVGADGINWTAELGLQDLVSGSNRFNSLSSLSERVGESEGISAVVSNPLSDANLRIYVDNPLDTISFFDGTDNNPATAENTGSLLAEFGGVNLDPNYVAGANNGAIQNIIPAYDAAGLNGKNMASGDITADFSRNVRVYDALGAGHDVRISFLKVGPNTWATEVHAIPASDVNSLLVDGQIATGQITFNGDGSLRSLETSLTSTINVTWTNAALASQINLDWGTTGLPFGTVGAAEIGLTDGLSQFDSDYNVAFVNQNGAPVGELIGVVIDEDGVVIASYSNGETQKLYKLPIADFTNPNGLKAVSGNVFAQTQESGEVNLRESGTNGTGKVVSAALESSNVELAEELTDMIVAQRAYQASSKVISTTDELLEELTRL